MMRNPIILNRIIFQTFKKNYCSLSIQHKIYKNQNRINFHYNYNNYFSCIIFNKNQFQKNVCGGSMPLFISFQRNLSNTAFVTKETEKATETVVNQTSAINEITDPTFFNSVVDTLNILFAEMGYQAILELNEFTGLPWWGTIALIPFVYRTIFIFPVALYQKNLITKFEAAYFNILNYIEELKEIEKEKKSNSLSVSLDNKFIMIKYEDEIDEKEDEFFRKYNCNPLKLSLLPTIQLFIWTTFTLGTAKLCLHPQLGIQLLNGGFGWVTNLTDIDHYMILPITFGLINLALIEVHQFMNNANTKERNKLIWSFRLITLLLMGVATQIPAGVNIYWISSSLYGLLQALLLKTRLMKRLLKTPISETQLTHYRK